MSTEVLLSKVSTSVTVSPLLQAHSSFLLPVHGIGLTKPQTWIRNRPSSVRFACSIGRMSDGTKYALLHGRARDIYRAPSFMRIGLYI